MAHQSAVFHSWFLSLEYPRCLRADFAVRASKVRAIAHKAAVPVVDRRNFVARGECDDLFTAAENSHQC